MYMDPTLNPFNPGAGLRPPEMAGRDGEVALFENLVVRARGHDPVGRGIVLSGLRGVGKTVLLRAMQNRAEHMGWTTVWFEGRTGAAGAADTRTQLGRNLVSAGRRLVGRTPTARVREAVGSIGSFSASLGVSGVTLGITAREGRADTDNLATNLTEMVEDVLPVLAAEGTGLALFVDELQDVDADLLLALLAAQHEAGQRELPFYVVGAGLPHLPGVLAAARSYAERLFAYRRIGPLHHDDARDALVVPAARYGATFTAPAVSGLVEASGGYPYFLQIYGKAVWDLAGSTTFTAEDAAAAIALGRDELDDGFYPARLQRATPAEREYLHQMSIDGDGPSRTTTLAERMGRTASSLSPVRQSLIDKGILYSPERGQIAYTVPGTADYLRRHPDA